MRCIWKRSRAGGAKLADACDNSDEDEADREQARDPISRIGGERRAVFAQALGDARRLATRAVDAGALPGMRGAGARPTASAADRTAARTRCFARLAAVIAIRAARAEDAAAIAAIYAPHVLAGTVSFETEAPDARAMRTRMAASDGLYPWMVATDGDEDDGVLGYAYATRSATARRTAMSSRRRSTSPMPRRARASGGCCTRR